jgi:hypothetical protein
MQYLSGENKTVKRMAKNKNIPVHHVKTKSDFTKLHKELTQRGFVAIDALKPGPVRTFTLGDTDPSKGVTDSMAGNMINGGWCTGPINSVAWLFDSRSNTPNKIQDKDGNDLGPGYVKWGAGDNVPSVIPPLAQALPYTASPLKYIADLTAGLGPKLMYRFADGKMVEYEYAGEILRETVEKLEAEEHQESGDMAMGSGDGPQIPGLQSQTNESSALRHAREALVAWKSTWNGYDEKDELGGETHIPGAKEFLENNNLNLHLSQCMQDDVMLDIYFPTVGFNKGRKGSWNARIVRCDMLPAHSTRLSVMNEHRYINNVYFSDSWRTKGVGRTTVTSPEAAKYAMYPAAMPQHLLADLRYIVEKNQRTAIKNRPMWVVCPTFYPSGQKPYYPQPAWWSVFSSKAFDFASTILYDKYKQRENSTSWGRILYISLDYLNMVFADKGLAGDEKAQQAFIDELDSNVEDFLRHRDNHGKMMRQFKWMGQDGKDHYNVEVVDVADAKNDEVTAGKNELELSTSPIFLALGVDPRLVGVPMVSASNGGTALREMHLLKQQQLNVKQRLYLNFLNTIARFNRWDEHATFIIAQQTLTTLDNSKTGTVETVAGEGA